MTIGKKLIGSFLIIALLLGITGVISSYYLNKIEGTYTDLIERRAVILSNILEAQVEVSKENSLLRGFMITKDAEFLDKLKKSYDNATSLISETEKLTQINEFKEALQHLDKSNQAFKLKYEQLIQMIQANEHHIKTTDFFVNEVMPLGTLLDPIADKLAKDQLKSMNEESEKSSLIVKNAIQNVAILSILAFILAVFIGYVCSRMISKPIVAMSEVAERIALGDLTIEDIKVKNNDEIGILAISFNQMTDNIRSLVRQISISSEQVASSSGELTASAEQTSQASEMITMSIQEVSTNAEMQSRNVNESVQSINEMSSGVQQIASSAQMTSFLTIETAQKAVEGNHSIQLTAKQMDLIHHTMNDLANAVTEMEEHSKEIELIVEVISEIAAQTNLLSLNAAIEAARAGEQGRGFAVVAGEVRKLAEQSSQSATQISQLVTAIKSGTHNVVVSTEAGVKEVSEGIQVVHTVGKLFEQIKRNIDEVSNQVQEISDASQQISASTEQVVHSIGLISDGSKTVAAESQSLAASTEEQLASMEEITSSASSLSSMAEELQDLVAKFKV
ncbi:chemotaxis protein [Paenibacillus antarcticus]|uniref:Chemotaxis protein n=2 Tax=Paenibacillus antarcticus TaxID=253703 RepID=A0A168LLY2_9BACL|nr:chemotaxis protein [Paenibacillus antarcticus]